MNWPTWAKARTFDKTFVTFWENVPEKVDGEWYAEGHHEIFPLVLDDILDVRPLPNLSEYDYWIKYAAKDENGRWFGYQEEPHMTIDSWNSSGRYRAIDVAHHDWKNSLIKR